MKLFLMSMILIISHSVMGDNRFGGEVIPSEAEMPQNSIYLELLGSGLFPTVNYERILETTKSNRNIALRLGLGAWAAGDLFGDDHGAVVPLSASYLLGDTHKLELGLGVTLINSRGCIPLIMGYRYKTCESGFLFRIGFTPIIGGGGIIPFGGLSLGYGF